jgi:uncharacterized protein YhfF
MKLYFARGSSSLATRIVFQECGLPFVTTEINEHTKVMEDGGDFRTVPKTIELTKRRFDEVDEAFAHDEGEGDRSLQYWREAHQRYFTRLGG